MRIAFVCRELASDDLTGEGALTFAAALALAQTGHEVYLVSARLADAWRSRLDLTEGLKWIALAPARPRHVYFTEQLEYADRVYDTVTELHRAVHLDIVELPDARGEALTLLRAKRLLGEFPTTLLVVTLHPAFSASVVDDDQPLTFTQQIAAAAEDYARRHADLVLVAASRQVDGLSLGETAVRRCLPAVPETTRRPPGTSASMARAREESAGRDIVWLGRLGPGCGLETLLSALSELVRVASGARVLVCGADTATDPFGRSYWRHLQSAYPIAATPAVVFQGPLRERGSRPWPLAGSPCLLAAGRHATPAETLVAVAAGFQPFAVNGGLAAEMLTDLGLGHVVPAGDPTALATALLGAWRSTPLTRAAGGSPAEGAERLRRRHASGLVARSRLEAYERPGRHQDVAPVSPGDAGLVSVVIPVYDQGAYLMATLESVHASGVKELDVVVVDDGSTDPATVELLDALDFPTVTVLRRAHAGLSAARNAGIARSRGDVVLVLDADDLVAAGFLAVAVRVLRERDDLAFVAGYARYFGLLDMVYVPVGAAGDLNLVLHTGVKSMVLYRRDALERVGGYDENLPAFEDWELQLRLDRAGYGSDVLPVVGQLYRRHARSMTFTTSNQMRGELVQYLVRKHAGALSSAELLRLVNVLVDMWKRGYEPSRSVLLQRAAPPSGTGHLGSVDGAGDAGGVDAAGVEASLPVADDRS